MHFGVVGVTQFKTLCFHKAEPNSIYPLNEIVLRLKWINIANSNHK